jgi:hypothetical protein
LRWRPVAAFPSFLRALNSRNYRLFFAGQSVSLVGNWMNPTASAWLAYELSHSAFVVGLVPFANLAATPLSRPRSTMTNADASWDYMRWGRGCSPSAV